MIKSLKIIFKKLGIDKAIALTLSSRILQAFSSILNIYLISLFMSKEEQGYYYTFGSLIAIQIFFELGLNTIIVQFVAHEVVHLKLVDNYYEGSEYNSSRLSSLLHFCIKVFGILAIILFFILTYSGYYFFNFYKNLSHNINWQYPWILLCLSTSIMLIIQPILGFLQGLGMIKFVARVLLFQQITSSVLTALILFFHGGLYTSGLSLLLSSLVVLSLLFFSNIKNILLNIWVNKSKWVVNYKNEIFPYQWKIALSWISGYFVFQLFNPVLFATEGPIVAGQMGMSLAVFGGISGLTMSWINTKVPLFSSLIAKKNFSDLDNIFNKSTIQSFLICIFLVLIFNTTIYFLQVYNITIYHRFLSLKFLIMLSLVTIVNQIMFSIATYLRCHKQEPFLLSSIILAILTASSTIVLGGKFGLNGIIIGYSIIMIFISAPWGVYIFLNKKKKWHLLETFNN